MIAERPRHRRGATFDLSGVITVKHQGVPVPDLTGWTGASKVKTPHGQLVADLEFSWLDASQRLARIRAQNTDNWPVGVLVTDILLTSPNGDKVPTDRAEFTCFAGVT